MSINSRIPNLHQDPREKEQANFDTKSQPSLEERSSSMQSSNHFDSGRDISPPAQQKSPWTYEEQQLLFQLHNKLGNRWSVIAEHFISKQKSDNSVKNHFYSRLRKALRKLNKIINSQFKRKIKEIPQNAIYKIIEVTELKHKKDQNFNTHKDPQNVQLCMDLKNRLLDFSYEPYERTHEQTLNIGKQLIEEILTFVKEHRKASRKSSAQSDEKRSKKSCLLREKKHFGIIMAGGSSTCSIFQTKPISPSPLKVMTTRKSTRYLEQNPIKNKYQTSTPTITSSSSSTCFMQQTESFFTDLNFLEDYSLTLFPLMIKQVSYTSQHSDKMNDERAEEFGILQQQYRNEVEEYQTSGMSSKDHFEDPELDEGKFSIFE